MVSRVSRNSVPTLIPSLGLSLWDWDTTYTIPLWCFCPWPRRHPMVVSEALNSLKWYANCSAYGSLCSLSRERPWFPLNPKEIHAKNMKESPLQTQNLIVPLELELMDPVFALSFLNLWAEWLSSSYLNALCFCFDVVHLYSSSKYS